MMKNMVGNRISHIKFLHTSYFSCARFIKSEINFQLKVEIKNIWFYHSNPYIHSTTILCDNTQCMYT